MKEPLWHPSTWQQVSKQSSAEHNQMMQAWCNILRSCEKHCVWEKPRLYNTHVTENTNVHEHRHMLPTAVLSDQVLSMHILEILTSSIEKPTLMSATVISEIESHYESQTLSDFHFNHYFPLNRIQGEKKITLLKVSEMFPRPLSRCILNQIIHSLAVCLNLSDCISCRSMLMTALNLTQEAELCKSYLYKTIIHVFEWYKSPLLYLFDQKYSTNCITWNIITI